MSPSHPNRSRRRLLPGANPKPDQVRKLREDMQLTQTAFGELLYSSLRAVQDWEGGQRRMPALAWEYASLLHGFPIVRKIRADYIYGRKIDHGVLPDD